MRILLGAALLLGFSLGAFGAPPESFPALTPNPSALAPLGEAVAVADVKNSLLLVSNARGALEPLDLRDKPLALGSAQKGQAVVLTGTPGGEISAHFLHSGQKPRVVRLKPAQPLPQPSDVASMNEILWVLCQTPPLVALFGSDGVELGRSDLSSVAVAPFSVALLPSGGGFVTDPLGPSVVELNSFGQFTALHKLAGSGYTRPCGVAAGADGRLWLSDTVVGEVAPFLLVDRQLVRDQGGRPIPVDDPVRVARSGNGLLILSGWSARITRASASD